MQAWYKDKVPPLELEKLINEEKNPKIDESIDIV
jgi:hypothetical protein